MPVQQRRQISNTTFYMPASPDWNDLLCMNMEFVIRVETNLKLNLIDKSGNRLVQNDLEKEVHFMRLESVSQKYPISLRAIPMLIKNYFNNKLEFEDWVITDFDHCLNGNPHIIL